MKENKPRLVAADIECQYTTECSLKELDSETFSRDSRSEPMLISMRGEDGSSYSGDPHEFDFEILDEATVIFHNASFDHTYLKIKAELGILDGCKPAQVYCSADLAAYCQYDRSLKGAVQAVFGVKLEKEIRLRKSQKKEE